MVELNIDLSGWLTSIALIIIAIAVLLEWDIFTGSTVQIAEIGLNIFLAVGIVVGVILFFILSVVLMIPVIGILVIAFMLIKWKIDSWFGY